MEEKRVQLKMTRRPNSQQWLRFFFLLIAVSSFCLPQILLAQSSQEKEARVEAYLKQADELYSAGNYQKAIDNYLQGSHIAEKKINLSRAYMGLSLCYFYLNETEDAKKYILKVLEIDPQKEVSSLFHPQTYVDLFDQVKRENKDILGLQRPKAVAEEPKAGQEEARKTEKQVPAPEEMILEEDAVGHWEMEVHYSGWSIDTAKSLFEDDLAKKVANEIREDVTDQLNPSHGGNLISSAYEQNLTMDSEGSNYGLEIRYYPLGRRGAFSLGVSLEKTKIRISIQGPVTQSYSDGSVAAVESEGYVETNPFTTNLSFRWDFFPSWRVTPYFVFGLGFGPLGGEASYVYTGTYRRESAQTSVQGEEIKTFDQLREEGDIELDLFIVLHTAIGVKGKIFEAFFIKGEVGFWDGLILRAGVGYRF
jgi:tetratricopeptide (TPR) repeat protein